MKSWTLPKVCVGVRNVFLAPERQVVDVEESRTPELFDRDAMSAANFFDGGFHLEQISGPL